MLGLKKRKRESEKEAIKDIEQSIEKAQPYLQEIQQGLLNNEGLNIGINLSSRKTLNSPNS